MNKEFEGYPPWVKNASDMDVADGYGRNVLFSEYETDRWLLTRVQSGHDWNMDVSATLHGLPIDLNTGKPFNYALISETLPGIYECYDFAQSVQKPIYDDYPLRVTEIIDGVELVGRYKDIRAGQIVQITTGPVGSQGRTWEELTDDEKCFADHFDTSSTAVLVKILQQPSVEKKI